MNPYRPTSSCEKLGASNENPFSKLALALNVVGLALATPPTAIGLIWISRFLIWHKFLGQPLQRGHRWLVLSILGFILISFFGFLVLVCGRNTLRILKSKNVH